LREIKEEPLSDGDWEKLKAVAGPDVERSQAANLVQKHPKAAKQQDAYEDGVAYESLSASGLQTHTLYRISLSNRDSAEQARCSIKVVVTEKLDAGRSRSGREIVPKSFEEVARVKPKVPGVKEGAFIQGSRSVMETFKVTSLSPFVPKSSKVYQAEFRTGKGTDNTFTRTLDFEVTE
jgi:hypothetical protein